MVQRKATKECKMTPYFETKAYFVYNHMVKILNYFGIELPGAKAIPGGLFCIDMEEVECIIQQLCAIEQGWA